MAFIQSFGPAYLALSLAGTAAPYPSTITAVYPTSSADGMSGAYNSVGVSVAGRWGSVYDGAVDLLLPVAVPDVVVSEPTPAVLKFLDLKSARMGNASSLILIGHLQTVGLPGSGADMIVSGGYLVSMPLSVPAQFGTVLLSLPLRNAILNQFIAATTPISFFHATNAAVATFYSGSAPASADDTATGTVLATTSLLSTDFIASSSGLINLAATRSLTPVATGTVGYMRMVSANGLTIQCGVGTLSGDVLLSSLNLTTGVVVTLKSLSIIIS